MVHCWNAHLTHLYSNTRSPKIHNVYRGEVISQKQLTNYDASTNYNNLTVSSFLGTPSVKDEVSTPHSVPGSETRLKEASVSDDEVVGATLPLSHQEVVGARTNPPDTTRQPTQLHLLQCIREWSQTRTIQCSYMTHFMTYRRDFLHSYMQKVFTGLSV